MTWYVVYKGKVPGLYDNWAQCNAQVCGYPNNCHKSFRTKEEAEASFAQFMLQHPLLENAPPAVVNNPPYMSLFPYIGACLLVVVVLLFIILGWRLRAL